MKAFLFDFDGLLVDTLHLHLVAIKETMKFLKVRCNKFDYKDFQGESTAKIAQIARNNSNVNFVLSDFIHLENKYFIDLLNTKNIKLQSGAIELLDYCKKWGLGTAIVTNANLKKEVQPVFDSMQNSTMVMDCFDFIITGDEGANRKPSPDIYYEALRRVGLSGTDCVAFEDSLPGAQAAHKSGCWVIGVGSQIEDDQVHHRVNTLHDVFSTFHELGHPRNIHTILNINI